MSAPRLNGEAGRADGSAEGTAMILAVLVAAVLTVLGMSYLAISETESRIARNERRSVQAARLAAAGLRVVKTWFDHPADPRNLLNPTDRVVDRSLRRIDHDGDPATPPWPQDGAAWPRYKQGVDLDADGADDLFDRPYRDGPLHATMGTEDGPDMRIDADASPLARAFLERLTRALVADFPGDEPGISAGIVRIDVYQPPHVPIAGAPVRHGLATVKVAVRIGPAPGVVGQPVAERTVIAVLGEIPYAAGARGPLRACGGIDWEGELTARWGEVGDAAGALLGDGREALPSSWPRVPAPDPGLDLLWGWDDDAAFAGYGAELEAGGEALEDPWFRYTSGGTVAGAPAGAQPYPFAWNPAPPDPLGDGTWPNHDHPGEDGNHSNLFQGVPTSPCDPFRYDLWKSIATSGERDVHHYVWRGGDRFAEDGAGFARSFREITDGAEGLLFFDTTDGRPPADSDGDGAPDNLTPPIDIDGGTWSVRGFVYVHARSLRAGDLAGRPATLHAPGEPFQDRDRDGVHDGGEPWVNLAYPDTIDGPFLVDAADALQDDGGIAGLPVRNRQGPAIAGRASIHGLLYNHGSVVVDGDATHYGTIVAGDVIGRQPTPQIIWDPRLRNAWPPAGWDLPRVSVTRWEIVRGP